MKDGDVNRDGPNAGRPFPSRRRWGHALTVQAQARAQTQGQARERLLLQLSPTAFFRGQELKHSGMKKKTYLPPPRALTARAQTLLF